MTETQGNLLPNQTPLNDRIMELRESGKKISDIVETLASEGYRRLKDDRMLNEIDVYSRYRYSKKQADLKAKSKRGPKSKNLKQKVTTLQYDEPVTSITKTSENQKSAKVMVMIGDKDSIQNILKDFLES